VTIYSKQNNQLTSYLSKKGESAKLREEMNLNYYKYHYIFVRQLPRTFSLAFRENKLKRPDYIVFLFLMGCYLTFYVDIKQRRFNREYNTFILYFKSSLTFTNYFKGCFKRFTKKLVKNKKKKVKFMRLLGLLRLLANR